MSYLILTNAFIINYAKLNITKLYFLEAMMDYSLILLVAGAVFLGSLMRSTFGFGDAVVSMPLLALLPVPFTTSVALVGLVGFTVALFFVVKGWKDKDPVVFRKLAVSTIAGIPFGLLLVQFVEQRWISFILGILLIVYSTYSLTGSKARQLFLQRRFQNTNYSLPFGFASGMLGSAYNMNGIPVVLYASGREWDSNEFMGNVQSHFLVSSVLIVFSHFLSGFWTVDLGVYYVFSIPAILAAVVLGKILYRKIKTDQFKRYVFYLIFILGLFNLLELF